MRSACLASSDGERSSARPCSLARAKINAVTAEATRTIRWNIATLERSSRPLIVLYCVKANGNRVKQGVLWQLEGQL